MDFADTDLSKADKIVINGVTFIKEESPIEHAAKVFADADSKDQAKFFTELENQCKGYLQASCFQWGYIRDEMTKEGIEILTEMYEIITEPKKEN